MSEERPLTDDELEELAADLKLCGEAINRLYQLLPAITQALRDLAEHRGYPDE